MAVSALVLAVCAILVATNKVTSNTPERLSHSLQRQVGISEPPKRTVAPVITCPNPNQVNSNTYGGNQAHTRNYCMKQFNLGMHRIWTVDTGGINEFPPSIHGGVAYLAQDDGFFTAYNTADGTIKWRIRIGHAADTPLYNDGRLYVSATAGVGYDAGPNYGLISIKASDGTILWRNHTLVGESSPTYNHGRVCVGTTPGAVSCVHPRSGLPFWTNVTACKTTGAVAVTGTSFYVGDYCGYITHYGYDGKVLWRAHPGGAIYGGVTVNENRVIVPNRDRGEIEAYNATTGAPLWKTPIGYNVYGSPAVTHGAVYATWRGSGPDGGFVKLNVTNGKILWRHITNAHVMASPVAVGNRVFFATCGDNYTKGVIVGYNVNGMNLVTSLADGRYTPVVPSGNVFLYIGFRTIYGYTFPRLDPTTNQNLPKGE